MSTHALTTFSPLDVHLEGVEDHSENIIEHMHVQQRDTNGQKFGATSLLFDTLPLPDIRQMESEFMVLTMRPSIYYSTLFSHFFTAPQRGQQGAVSLKLNVHHLCVFSDAATGCVALKK